MRWLDVAGSPASGKSTRYDGRSPRKIPESCNPPVEWDDFIDVAYHLLKRVDQEECAVIFARYLGKIAAINNRRDEGVYTNTGLAQAGLEIGWRLPDAEDVAPYFEQMPVSEGVVFLWADEATLIRRNRERKRDRSHMVPGMERARRVAEAVLRGRGVDVCSIDTGR